ncbi:unnamed protein product [Gordionus sp. m RMFG-2023]|uniref:WD repeat-containing protein 18-like isoform X2 n=2 Tax=Gordionus sp. m RMFG-2023 TaxID=3053472 RepID=UPI0030E53B70
MVIIANGFTKNALSTFPNVTIWNLDTGLKTLSLKIPAFAQDLKTNKIINSKFLSFDAVGHDYIISSWSNKTFLNIYNLKNNYNLHCKFKTDNIISIVKVSYDKLYLALATKNIFQIWKLNTGQMLCNVDYHYQDITCIEFTHDSSYVITGGMDNLVYVWSLSKLAKQALPMSIGEVEPIYIWNQHSLPITDIYVSKTGLNWKSRIYTISLDHTCKVYDLALKGTFLCSVDFPSPLTKLASGSSETQLFFGSLVGDIYRVDFTCVTSKEDFAKDGLVYKGHNSKIIGLETLSHKFQLISACEAGLIKTWNFLSFQCLKTLDTKIFNGFISEMTTMHFIWEGVTWLNRVLAANQVGVESETIPSFLRRLYEPYKSTHQKTKKGCNII